MALADGFLVTYVIISQQINMQSTNTSSLFIKNCVSVVMNVISSIQASKLKEHKQTKHEGIKFISAECKYEGNSKSRFSNHVLSRHRGKKYKCDLGEMELSQKGHVKIHKQTKHEPVYNSTTKNVTIRRTEKIIYRITKM